MVATLALFFALTGGIAFAVDADGTGGDGGWCEADLTVYANGNPLSSVRIEADAEAPPPYNAITADGASAAIGLAEPGVVQNVTVGAFGDPGCGTSTTASLRVTVVELG